MAAVIDEICFHLSGYEYINSQSSHVWSTVNPHEIENTPLNDQKISVWCATS
jgi:hypothetical protein